MKNKIPYLSRKLQNFRVLQKVGDMRLHDSTSELAKVQQRQHGLRQDLLRSQAKLAELAVPSNNVLVPELMASQSLYVGQLVRQQQQTELQLQQQNQLVDEQLNTVLKLKKTNQLVADKIVNTRGQMINVVDQQMDEAISDIRRATTTNMKEE
ncbi:MAG: hypothetical protein ACI8WB_001311 [Phenylobacterium sp.]|jgi:hypothetical protein